jgi:hypothetical protein
VGTLYVAAAKTWDAETFELKSGVPPLSPESSFWVSKAGLLLVIETGTNKGNKITMELARFEQRGGSALAP